VRNRDERTLEGYARLFSTRVGTEPRPENLIGDRAYDSDKLDAELKKNCFVSA